MAPTLNRIYITETMSFFDNRLTRFRAIAWIEGISYIFLLFVAMPMKYIGGQPAWVRYSGLVHGLLFVLFIINAIQAKIEYSWSRRRLLLMIATSFVPFGMIWFDRLLEAPEKGSEIEQRPPR
jgi:integral membrane protein